MPTVQVNGIRLSYEIQGAGHPLLLIGGLGADVTLFGGIIAGLARHHQVIAFDNRGAGRTEKPEEPYPIEVMAQDAAGLLDALDVARADVLGFSMGGRIALELALARPGLVRRLVLVSTERQRQASLSYDGSDRLGQIRVPTLIAHGRSDKSMPLALAERTQAGITGSELEVFPGGHMFFLFSQQQSLLDRVERFLGSGDGDGVRITGDRLLLRALRPEEIDDEWRAMVDADPMTIAQLPDEVSFRTRLARSGHLEDGWIDLAIDAGGTSIGRIQTFVPPGRSLPPGTFEIGIGLRESARGKGYGREALAIFTDWLFEHAAAEVVEAPTDPQNVAMRTVFDRVGWELVGSHHELDREWVRYRITRRQWRVRQSQQGARRG